MEVAAAKHAGELAAAVEVRNLQTTAISTAIAEDWRIISCRARDPNTGNVIELVLDNAAGLDSATSQQSLQFILSIYQAQLDALNTELGAV